MKKHLKGIIFIILIAYAIITVFEQQKTLDTYKLSKENLIEQISNEQEEKEELIATKESINSKEFIEKYVRKNLGMYYPDEIVFENIGL